MLGQKSEAELFTGDVSRKTYDQGSLYIALTREVNLATEPFALSAGEIRESDCL